MTPTPLNPHKTITSSTPPTTTARARSAEAAEDPVMLASMIEKNRGIINRGWEELAQLTRMLDALDAREAKIVENDLKTPTRGSIHTQAAL